MSLITELNRRNVFRVAAAYLALAWVVAQITDIIVPALNLPPTLVPIVIWIGVIGFPFVVMFSWAYELTPEGLRREHEVDRNQSITAHTGRRLDHIVIALMVVAIAMFGYREFVPREEMTGADAVGAGHARDNSAESGTPVAEEGRGHGPLLQEETPTAAVDPKSIAVLPFVNMSDDAGNEYFSDGIAEELLNLLAKIPELRVTSRSSAFAFKGEKFDIAEVAAKLHVAHILEGSVRKSGNRVRITAQLVDVRSDTHLWSETYDRTLDDIFAVQDEIAGAVVAQLKITLLGAAPTAHKRDPKAYALVLQARQLSEQRTAEGLNRATALLDQALAIDPEYADALVARAQNLSFQANNGELPIDEGTRLAREATDRALAIDPQLASAHAMLGQIAMSYDGDFAAAARHLERAMAVDPANEYVMRATARLAVVLGRFDVAMRLQQYMVERDPVSAFGHDRLGATYLYSGRYDEAIASYETALSLSPARIVTHYNLGCAQLLQGKPELALATMQQEPDPSWRLFGLAIVQHALGRHAESDAALEQIIAKYEKDSAYNIAYVLAARGEADRAFEWLDKAVAYRDGGLTDVVIQPFFKPLYADPRWLAFLRKLGRAPEQLDAIRLDVTVPGA